MKQICCVFTFICITSLIVLLDDIKRCREKEQVLIYADDVKRHNVCGAEFYITSNDRQIKVIFEISCDVSRGEGITPLRYRQHQRTERVSFCKAIEKGKFVFLFNFSPQTLNHSFLLRTTCMHCPFLNATKLTFFELGVRKCGAKCCYKKENIHVHTEQKQLDIRKCRQFVLTCSLNSSCLLLHVRNILTEYLLEVRFIKFADTFSYRSWKCGKIQNSRLLCSSLQAQYFHYALNPPVSKGSIVSFTVIVCKVLLNITLYGLFLYKMVECFILFISSCMKLFPKKVILDYFGIEFLNCIQIRPCIEDKVKTDTQEQTFTIICIYRLEKGKRNLYKLSFSSTQVKVIQKSLKCWTLLSVRLGRKNQSQENTKKSSNKILQTPDSRQWLSWERSQHVWPFNRFFPDALDNPAQDMAYLGYRLATLSALPASVPVSRVKLADAGFYFRGQGDEVFCYRCPGRYSGWRMGDNPLDIHRRISPSCPHVAEMDRELSALTSHEMVSIETASSDQVPSGHVTQNHGRDASEDGDSESPVPQQSPTPLHPTSPESRGNATGEALVGNINTGIDRVAISVQMFPSPTLDLGGAVYPMYQDMASRRRSYPAWNERAAPPLDQMILCGMYYAGYADCVRCFYCGVGLKSWEVTDDVWREHIRWRPNCGYLRAVKGENFIRQMLDQIRRESAGEGRRGSSQN